MGLPAELAESKLTPYWWESAQPPELPPAEIPKSVDVAVVGAGYTGLAAALTLARADRSVLVFEADKAGQGASTRNGGQVSGEVKTRFLGLIDYLGLEQAKAVVTEGRMAREYLSALTESEGFDCNLRWVGRFHAAHTIRDYDAMGREAEAVRKHLGIETEMVPRSEQGRAIGSDRYCGGAIRHDKGGFQPAMFFRCLLERAIGAGAVISAENPVTGIRDEGRGFTVATRLGNISARNVIVTTNGYTGKVTPWLRRRIIPIQSQTVATSPLAPEVMERLIPQRRMVVDSRRLHNYYRPSPDGTRIIFGGRAGATETDPKRSGALLYRQLTTIFPELQGVPITHCWSGFTGYTFDSLPHVGMREGLYYAIGFCGGGAGWGPYLGHKVALKVLDLKGAETVFDERTFPTKPLYFGKPWFLPGVIQFYGMLDRLRL